MDTDPPPPPDQTKRKLCLKSSMLKQLMDATKLADMGVEASVDPADTVASEASFLKMEGQLHQLEMELKMEQRLLDELRVSLEVKQRELGESEHLLEARAKLVELRYNQMTSPQPTAINAQERQALEVWQKALEEREHSLQKAQEMLDERDAYVETCENTLVSRMIELSEREATVEQREEDLFNKVSSRMVETESRVS